MPIFLPLVRTAGLALLGWIFLLFLPSQTQKMLEKLNRGVVAVHTASSQAYVGWRLFGAD